MALIDRGVVRTGKQSASNKAMVGGADLCGPDQHMLQAKARLQRRNEAMGSANGMAVPYDWEADRKDYEACAKIEKRKSRGGATFRPGDGC